jgi:hypothetical protein
MPYGLLFQDTQSGDTQNMGIFPQGVAVVVSEPGPAGPHVFDKIKSQHL